MPFIAAVGVSAVPFDALDKLALAKRQESNASGLSDFDILQLYVVIPDSQCGCRVPITDSDFNH